MAARKSGRYLAPIALLAVAAAIFLVVRAHVRHVSHSSTSGAITSSLVQTTRHQSGSHRHHAAKYTIRSGDTLSGISFKTGIPVGVIQRLNPGLNPNALQTGQVLKLRP